MQCRNCGRELEGGEYCPWCGAHQTVNNERHVTRRPHVYAANPSEHVLQPSIVTTFFPHLGARRTFQVRWLLFVAVVVLIGISLARLAPLAIILSALLLPVLYLFYFYDAQLYEDEPFVVLGATFLVGAILGGAMSLLFYRLILSQSRLGFGPSTSYVLLVGVLLPIIAQILMLIGPLTLYIARRQFDDVLDGLAFGTAAGLGFSATQSIAYAWYLINGPFMQRGSISAWVLPSVKIALFIPLLDAATTGLICAALWLRRDRQPESRTRGAVTNLAAAIVIGLLGQIIPALGSALWGGPILDLLWYGVPVIILLLLVRTLLHIGLIDKAQPLRSGGVEQCPQCHHPLRGAEAFCPYCGLALRATPHRVRGHRAGRGGRPGQEPASGA
ncbi:MAG TPA: PrsW family glutamic-type intramembrane protease [Ktedonobacterales bacterium]|nr:PrsW family glutamic-type intramembrane protease [Ktedonobacterales bacterium]